MNVPNFRKIDLVTYKPGRSLLSSKKKVIKLSANESAFGAGERVRNILKNRNNNISKYPDSKFKKLIETISKKFNLNKEKIICGAGSDEIIQMICTLFLNKGDEVVVPQYSFLMYRIYAKIVGAKVKFSKEVNFKVSVDEILKKVGRNTKIVFIANPNNPTGTYNNHDQVVNLLKNVSEDILVVLDCAYYEYVKKEDYVRTNELLNEFDNLIITKSFSKAHGLASLRVGYGVASKGIIAALNKIRQPFNVNSFAQELAYFSLCDKDHISESVRVNSLGMEFLEDEFSKLNIEYIDSVGNFISFKTKRATHEIYEDFLKNGIIIRPIESYDMPNFLRVTIGTATENSAFIETLEQLL